jgi:hypothetical protein
MDPVRQRPLPVPRTQKLTIIAQDPGVRDQQNCIIRAVVELPAENLSPDRGVTVCM